MRASNQPRGPHMSNEERLTRLEITIENINHTLYRLDKRFDEVDKRFELIDKKFELIDNKIDKLRSDINGNNIDINNRLWMLFRWMIGLIFGLAVIMGHGFHWF